jgi:hypothetical protein
MSTETGSTSEAGRAWTPTQIQALADEVEMLRRVIGAKRKLDDYVKERGIQEKDLSMKLAAVPETNHVFMAVQMLLKHWTGVEHQGAKAAVTDIELRTATAREHALEDFHWHLLELWSKANKPVKVG